MAKLKEQFASYDDFVRQEVLPNARADFRLPAELYTIALEQYGVDFPSAELTRRAHQAFAEIQGEMKPLAADREAAPAPFQRLSRRRPILEERPNPWRSGAPGIRKAIGRD